MNWLDTTKDESVAKIFTTILDSKKIKYVMQNISDDIIIRIENVEANQKEYLDFLFRVLKITYGGK